MIACASHTDLLLTGARAGQLRWAATPVRERLAVVRELRHRIAENAERLADAVAKDRGRPLPEKLASEVLPLADACRWLERSAGEVLATQRFGMRRRPWWLHGVRFEVRRQACGVVLVIGPGNYPLLLPAVHALYALVAGNAVLLKPAPGMGTAVRIFAKLSQSAGLDPSLLMILPESPDAARGAIREGVDKVVFTGSTENGRAVLSELAETGTPSVMELSGEDAVVVFADADLDLVKRALEFGTRLNGGETCMVPRRILAEKGIADSLRRQFAALEIDVFSRADDALARIEASEYGLGLSVFSRDLRAARAFAARVRTGFVVINDLIAPTADPRMPFGGVKASGFGTTRGAEGLLEMTFPHVVMVRHGRARPHYDELREMDSRLFASYIRAAHGRSRFAAWSDLVGVLRDRNKPV